MADIDKLTSRERELLQLIGRYGFSSKQAARAVGISRYRVDDLCESAMRRLEVHSRREAVMLVMASLEESMPAPLLPNRGPYSIGVGNEAKLDEQDEVLGKPADAVV